MNNVFPHPWGTFPRRRRKVGVSPKKIAVTINSMATFLKAWLNHSPDLREILVGISSMGKSGLEAGMTNQDLADLIQSLQKL